MTTYEEATLLIQAATLVTQAIILIAGIATVIVYFRQHQFMRDQLQQTIIMQRRELYVNMTTSLEDEDVVTMMLHAADHFDLDVYEKRYKGHYDRIKSYFLMKRKYLYLLLSTSFNTNEKDPGKAAPALWLNELCEYQEFRDVHESQKKYYPQFGRMVDNILSVQGGTGTKWALTEFDSPDLSRSTVEGMA